VGKNDVHYNMPIICERMAIYDRNKDGALSIYELCKMPSLDVARVFLYGLTANEGNASTAKQIEFKDAYQIFKKMPSEKIGAMLLSDLGLQIRDVYFQRLVNEDKDYTKTLEVLLAMKKIKMKENEKEGLLDAALEAYLTLKELDEHTSMDILRKLQGIDPEYSLFILEFFSQRAKR
jgi:Ca2+-binding EF-hand superfamily protein